MCDAGCGCGVCTLKLFHYDFNVSGFDVAEDAVKTARKLLEQNMATADLKTEGVLKTGYANQQFDAVICRDVLDHIPMSEARPA